MKKINTVKVQSINSKGLISTHFGTIFSMVLNGKPFTDCLDFLQLKARETYPNSTTGAVNNCRGRWFEIILTFFCNYQSKNYDLLFLKLGTASEHTIFDIFTGTTDQLKILLAKGHSLNLSIPDLIVLDIGSSKDLKKWKKDLCDLSPEKDGKKITESILSGYKSLTKNPISLDDCRSFCSIKTSLRPDRKYQAMYEAEFVKAFQKRFFPATKKIPKYVMVGPLEAQATRTILENNLSLTSINDGSFLPTIDKVCVVNNIKELDVFISYCKSI